MVTFSVLNSAAVAAAITQVCDGQTRAKSITDGR